jgi:hypothetical protein
MRTKLNVLEFQSSHPHWAWGGCISVCSYSRLSSS